MSEGPRLVQVGISGATPVFADVTQLYPAISVNVLLSANYQTLCPPGWPGRPAQLGVTANQAFPKTVLSGSTWAFLKPEADAIVAAGGGSYV